MSTEKLASDELAHWREKTIKKVSALALQWHRDGVSDDAPPPQNLEMIKVREEEAGTVAQVMRQFTYKGEVEIDVADDSKIEVQTPEPFQLVEC